MNWFSDRRDADRARAERDVDAELDFHRQATIDELLAAGMTPEAAEAEARRRFGPLRPYRSRMVDLDLQPARPSIWSDLKAVAGQSIRSMFRDIRHAPGFTFGVVLILTIGLGINALTLGLVDRLVLSGPAGITASHDVRRTVLLRMNAQGSESATVLSYSDYRDLLETDGLAGAAAESSIPMLYGSGDQAEEIRGVLVSANYFPLLGVNPSEGRFFTADESETQGARVAVLGYGFWQRRFAGDTAVMGTTMQIESHRYTVIGIAPRHFTGTSVARADVFLPLEAAADEQVSGPWQTSRNFRWLGAIVRLAPGTTAETAASEATVRLGRAPTDASTGEGRLRVTFAPLNPVRGASASSDASIAALVGGVAFLVLLIAFANVANLFLARSLRRRDRVILRLALGGARWRLIAEEAAEGAWLGLLGVAVAVAAASVGAPVLQQLLFPDVAWVDARINLPLLVVLGLCAAAGGALAAALPMWQAGRTDAGTWLKGGTARGPRTRTRTQAAMLVVQGALSVLLLVGAGLFVRSMTEAESLDVGLDTDTLLAVLAVSGDAPPPEGFTEELADRVARMPGVASTTRVAGTTPFISSWGEDLSIPDLPTRPRVDDGGPYLHAVTPGYFDTVGTQILRGRAFTDEDRQGSQRVVIVNDSLARLYWPGEEAIGKCMRIGEGSPPCSTIVGISENTHRQSLVEGRTLMYYMPMAQAPEEMQRFARVLIRVSDDAGGASSLPRAVSAEALALAPGLRFVNVRSLDDIISPQLRTWRLGAGLFSVFGVLALIVATVGLYSVVAFDVEGRRREMSVRSALGARPASLVRLVMRNALQASLAGLIVGLILAWLLSPLVADLLYVVSSKDARVFAAAAALLLVAAIVASAVPGLRAARVDPCTALREE